MLSYSARPLNGVALLLCACVVLAGCRKPEEDLGLDLLPGDPLGVVTDTSSVHAFTFADTAVRTSGLTRNLLGSYLDQDFGLVKAGFVAQLRLSTNNVGSGQDNSGLVADSIVLALAFDGANYVYGNLDPQVVRVYELDTLLSIDSSYYTTDVPPVIPVDLCANRGGRIVPQPFAGPVIGGDTLLPQLRIRLVDELAGRILSRFGTSDLADNNSFLSFFNGIHVTVDNGPQPPFQQGILYLSLLNGASKATLYYHNTNNNPEQLRTLDLPINSNSVRYTVAEHDHAQAIIPGVLQALADTVTPPLRTYVQTLGALRTAVRFPHLMEYADQGRILAKAELVVPIAGAYNGMLPPPSQLFIFRKDENGADAFLPDQLSGLAAIGGLYNAATREYRFNITRYINDVLSGNLPNNGVELVCGSNGVTANRAILAGPAAEGGMRLQLTFTTY
jgi:hypothetical protein